MNRTDNKLLGAGDVLYVKAGFNVIKATIRKTNKTEAFSENYRFRRLLDDGVTEVILSDEAYGFYTSICVGDTYYAYTEAEAIRRKLIQP